MLGLAGLTMDYGNSLAVQSQLDAAADEAALEGVSTSGNPNMTLPTPGHRRPLFLCRRRQYSKNVAIKSVTVNASTSVDSLFVTMSYTASVTTVVQSDHGLSLSVSGQCLGRGASPEIRQFLSAARQFALDGARRDDHRYFQHGGGHPADQSAP